MPIGLGSGLFAVCLPVEKTNLVQNPSFEQGTTYWGTSTSGVIGTSSAFQQFGAWSCICTPSAATTDGIRGGSVPLIDGAYAVSAYIRGAAGVVYNLEIAPAPTGNALGSSTITGNGAWQYTTLQYTEAGGGGGTITRAVVVRKRNDVSVAPFYVDGVQVEAGSVTTYIDGDQIGGAWLGAAHTSPSYRSGQYRGGGSVVALADIGLQVDQMLGAGVMPIEVSTQSYAIVDGAQFQRQRASQRLFTLTAKPIVGTSLADFHITRRTVFDALKPDAVTPQQPIRFLYYGGQGTQYIDGYYDKGLELGNMHGPIAEDAAISFIAPDPYWHSPTQSGTTLAPRLNLGSARYIACRDSLGRWGTMGPIGSALDGQVLAILPSSSGVVYVAGGFGSAGGTRVRFIAQWSPRSGQWGSLAGGTLNNTVNALLEYPTGSIYVAAGITTANGTTANGAAVWSPAGSWGTLGGGGFNAGASPTTITRGQNGTLYWGGVFTTVAGTQGTSAAQYSPITDRWGTMRGLTHSDVNATGLDGKIFYGGSFALVNGTAAGSIAFWNPKTSNWGTLGGGGVANPLTNGVQSMAVGPNGVLYVGGDFGSAGGGSVSYFTSYNGVQFTGYGSGLNGPALSLFAGSNGAVYIAGGISIAGGVTFPQGGALFNGAGFIPLDSVIANPSVFSLAADGTLYVGMELPQGSLFAASVAQLVNTGRAIAYPTLRIRCPTNGTARLFQVMNTTTGAGIYFTATLAPGETATLTTTPGERSFTSSYQGNILGQILPGSNLTSFNLSPGTNYLSFFSDNDSLEASFFWQNRGWSIDSGTVV